MTYNLSSFFSKHKKPSLVTRFLLSLTILCFVCLTILKVLEFCGIPSHSIYLEKKPKTTVSQSPVKPAQTSLYERISIRLNLVYHEGVIDGDSWRPMVLALEHVKKFPQRPVYDEFFEKGVKFQYPLTSLLLFDLPERVLGVPYDLMVYFLRLITFLSVFMIAYICSKILLETLRQDAFKKFEIPPSENLISFSLILVLTILFYPIYKGYQLGQIQPILTLLSTIVILYWQRDKKKQAGVILGLICLIKPQLGLLFLWAIIRKQWKMVTSGVIVMSIFGVISLAFYGFNNNFDYLRILSFLSDRGEAFYANQSVNGLMHRLLFNGSNLVWDSTFPPYSPIVHRATLISSAILILSGLFWNYKQKKPHVLDLCIMILCATMASPIAWEHHYAVLFPIFIIMSPFALYYYYDKKNWVIAVMAVGYVLTSLYFEITKSLAETIFNVAQSYLFIGAFIILILLLVISAKVNKSESQFR